MKNLIINHPIISLIKPPSNKFFDFFVMQPKTCTMTMQLAVMDPYAEHFVIFAYILMDHLVVKPRILQLYKKKF